MKKIYRTLLSTMLLVPALFACEKDKGHQHEYDYNSPTWEWNGYESAKLIFSCSSCEDYIDGHYLSFDANVNASVVSNPNCVNDGSILHTATYTLDGTDYSDTKTEVTSALGHKEGKEWSHNEETHWHVCDVCGEKIDSSISGHTFIAMSNDTYHYEQCAICGYVDSSKQEEHQFGDWEFVREDCSRVRTCNICGYRDVDSTTDIQYIEIKSVGYNTAAAIQLSIDLPYQNWNDGDTIDTQFLSVFYNGEEKTNLNIQYFSAEVLSINLGSDAIKGDTFEMKKNSMFTDGNFYRILDNDLSLLFNGTNWVVVDKVVASLNYHWGNESTIMLKDPLGVEYKEDSYNLDKDLLDVSINGKSVAINAAAFIGLDSDEDGTKDSYVIQLSTENMGDGVVLTIYKGSVFSSSVGVFVLTNSVGFKYENNVWVTCDPMDKTLSPEEMVLSFEGFYATGDIIQIKTGLQDGCGNIPAANFLFDDTAYCSIKKYGTGGLGYMEIYSNMESMWCIHFNLSAEGQYVVIEKGSTFTMSNGNVFAVDNDYMFVRDAEKWNLRKVNENEMTIKFISYSTASLVQVVTNAAIDTKGADTSAGDNGIINLVHPNDTVLWGYYGSGIHPTYQTTYIGFNFNSEVETGKVMVLGKGTTLKMEDDSIMEFGVTYSMTYTGSSWSIAISL